MPARKTPFKSAPMILGARMSEGALQIGRTAGDARGDERKKNAADGGERVKGVGDDGDRA
jgi:hypothetical protein